jgi:hypothetical protein
MVPVQFEEKKPDEWLTRRRKISFPAWKKLRIPIPRYSLNAAKPVASAA